MSGSNPTFEQLSVMLRALNAEPRRAALDALLPFADESSDAGGEYLSDGLSESLINKLSQPPQLKVATRNSAFQYKNKLADAREIAHSTSKRLSAGASPGAAAICKSASN